MPRSGNFQSKPRRELCLYEGLPSLFSIFCSLSSLLAFFSSSLQRQVIPKNSTIRTAALSGYQPTELESHTTAVRTIVFAQFFFIIKQFLKPHSKSHPTMIFKLSGFVVTDPPEFPPRLDQHYHLARIPSRLLYNRTDSLDLQLQIRECCGISSRDPREERKKG
jgi:hypothetical protein